MSKLITVSQLNATPEGTYINGEVRAVLSRAVEPKNPKAPWKAMLSDSTGIIEASLWGGSVAHWEGRHVVLSGKGMKIQEYKGVKSLSVGDKVDISFGGAPGTAAQDEHMEGDPMPHTANPVPATGRFQAKPFPALKTPQQLQEALDNPPVNLPHGATVGGALARAVDIALGTGALSMGGFGPGQVAIIERITRDLVEIQGRIERGEPMKQPVIERDADIPF